jgi:hypothetical protein
MIFHPGVPARGHLYRKWKLQYKNAMPGKGRQSSGFNFSNGKNSGLTEQNFLLAPLDEAFRIPFASPFKGAEEEIPIHQNPFINVRSVSTTSRLSSLQKSN